MEVHFGPFLLPDPSFELFDIYKLLEESGVSYITYEDTGKVWPLQDTKVAILKTSQDLYAEMYAIHTAYLLNVSPFILNLVTQYVLDAEKDGFASLVNLVKANRERAEHTLQGSLLEPVTPLAKISVLWCKITREDIQATELKAYLESKGVHVLPGTYFYWNNPSLGERYIRIALARDTHLFKEAMTALRKALDEY